MLARRGLCAQTPLSLWQSSPLKFPQQFSHRPASNVSSVAAQTASPRLEDWLRNNGGSVNHVELVYNMHPSDRRLITTSDVEAGTCLITVPKHLQLRYDTVTDEKLTKLFSQVPKGSDTGGSAWQFKQALLLLHHVVKGPSSPLHDYISHLPGVAPGVPTPRIAMLMSDPAVSQLQYTPLIQDGLNHKYWWEQFTSTTLASLPGSDADAFDGTRVSKGLFGWAVAVVISRCFGLNSTGVHTMAPLIDMANHSLESNCEMRSGPEGQVSMLAKKAIKRGEPLLLTYGSHDNHNLLLSYGFVLPDNPNERYRFELDMDVIQDMVQDVLPAPMPLRPWQLHILQQLGFRASPGLLARAQAFNTTTPALNTTTTTSGGAPLKVHLGGQPPVDPRLMAALRVATLNDEAQVLATDLPLEKLGRWEVPLARQQELLVLQLLKSLITELYRSFPTTIQQDRQLLPDADESAAAAATASSGPGATSGLVPEVVMMASSSTSNSSSNSENGSPAVGGLGPTWRGELGAGQQQQDLMTAVTYRLGMKLALERSLKEVVARYKFLDELQRVR